MRKAINMSALIVFIWLLLDAFRVPDMLLGFLLAGALPGIPVSLSPSLMLALLTTTGLFITFEFLARRIEAVARFRQNIIVLVSRNWRLSLRNLRRA